MTDKKYTFNTPAATMIIMTIGAVFFARWFFTRRRFNKKQG